MALTNYVDLQASVANFLHRTDLTSVIPDLITLAEGRINGDLDARLQDTNATLATVANVETVAIPSDAINMRHLSISSTSPVVVLRYLAPDAYEKAFPYKTTGLPSVFTVVGSDFYLAPIPDSAYSIDCVYKAKVPSLSTLGTTWLMTKYPMVYLYATLCEAAPYIKDTAQLAVWEQKYREAIISVNSQDWYSGSTLTVRTDTPV